MRKFLSLLVAGVLVAGTTLGVAAGTASADACTGVWSIGIGGVTVGVLAPGITGETSLYIAANQPEGYNSVDIPAGITELNRLVTKHRAECPADHIMLVGHSGGALVAHTWIYEHQDFPNLNAVLISDPKRPAGPGGPGFSAIAPLAWLPWPYSGLGYWSDFGNVPVLEVCHPNDHVCNGDADWSGYLAGVHTNYDFWAQDYSTTAEGNLYQ